MAHFSKLNKDKYFGQDFKLGEDEIHVLVALPPPKRGLSTEPSQIASKLTSFDMALKQNDKHGDLPSDGDFLNLFEWTDEDCGTMKNIEAINAIVGFTGSQFYVRKEILCVLENFMKIYHDEFTQNKVCKLEFILMGSPGTGKSCILALICFYIAIKLNRPVLWRRQVQGFQKSWTRLFYEGKHYEWEDDGGMTYKSLYSELKRNQKHPWFCLDGFSYKDICEKDWASKFRILATSGQYRKNSEGMEFSRMCLVPYWKRDDLQDFGGKYSRAVEEKSD